MTVVIGIIFVIAGILTWIGALSVAQAIAVLIGGIGVLLILSFTVPARYWRRP